MSGLQTQIVSVPFTGSLDTKTDAAQVGHGDFLSLANSVFDTSLLASKRYGFTKRATQDISGNTLAGGQAMGVLGDEEAIICTNHLYGYAKQANRWVDRGAISSLKVSEDAIVKTAFGQTAIVSASLSGVTVYAWEDSRGGVWGKVVDEVSGTVYLKETQLESTSVNPKALVCGTKLVIFAVSSALVMNRWVIDPASPSSVPGPVSTFTSSDLIFDMVTFPAAGVPCIVYGGDAHIKRLDLTSFAVLTSVAGPSLGQINSVELCAYGAAGVGVTFGYSDAGPNLLVHSYLFNASNLAAGNDWAVDSIVSAGGTERITRLAAVAINSTSFQLYFQVFKGGYNYIKQIVVANSGVSGLSVFVRGQCIASEVFTQGSVNYLLTVFPSSSQGTCFLLDSSARVVAKGLQDLAAYDPDEYRIPNAINASGIWTVAAGANIEFLSVGGKATFIEGVSRLTFDFTYPTLVTQTLGENLHVSGGIIQVYDGDRVNELGFNYFPEKLAVAPLTSFIGLATIQDNVSGLNTVITFPANPDPLKTDGALIQAGEYITYGGNIGGVNGGFHVYSGGTSPNLANYFWFKVDGKGTDPALGGVWVANEVDIASTDTGAQIATKLITAIKASSMHTVTPGQYVTITQPHTNQVRIDGFGGDAQSHCALNTLFEVSTGNRDIASPGSTQTNITISTTKGELIHPGQYFLFRSRTVAPAIVTYYVWFAVDGVGTDPKPGGTTSGILCSINSTDTELDVAVTLKTALDGPGFRYTTSNNGNQVAITNTDKGTFDPDEPGENPSVGGVGMGHLTIGDFPGVPGDPDPSWNLYEYLAIYEQVDGKGQLHRSPTSLPLLVTLPSWSTDRRVQVKVTVSTLRLTGKPYADIAIFRSEANGADIQYRVTSPVTLLMNDTTVDTVTFDDFMNDVDLVHNEPSYNDAEIENDAPPAATFLLNHKDRLWAIVSKNLVWYSKEFQGGLGVAFNAGQTIRFDPIGGDLTALGSLDANLVAFEDTKIWIVAGDGPANSGQGAPFSEPILVSSTVGCRDPKSVCITPDGLIFKSHKGWMLLDRSTQVQPIGVRVKQFDADVCTSATAIDGTHQIRLISASGTSLVLDWLQKKWGALSNHLGVDSMMVGGVYHYLRSDGKVYIENPGSYLDDGTGYSQKIETAWNKFVGLQGYQVVRKAWIKGYFPGTNPLKVTIDYDFGTPTAGPRQQIVTLNPGTDDAGNVNPDQVQFMIHLKYHSCEAVKFTFEDQSPFDSAKAYNIGAIDFEVGVMPSGFRQAKSQQSLG